MNPPGRVPPWRVVFLFMVHPCPILNPLFVVVGFPTLLMLEIEVQLACCREFSFLPNPVAFAALKLTTSCFEEERGLGEVVSMAWYDETDSNSPWAVVHFFTDPALLRCCSWRATT